VFETVFGIPAHPLIIHAAVVFIPLQIAAAIVYGLVPLVRRHIWWAVLGLAIVAPIAAFAAKLSGEAFEQRLLRKGQLGSNFDAVTQHASFAASTTWWTLGLSVTMLLLLFVTNRTRVLAPVKGDTAEITHDAADIMGSPATYKLATLVLAVIAVIVSGFLGYYVFKTGDTGAHIVWGQY
jgi:hypothetical protein